MPTRELEKYVPYDQYKKNKKLLTNATIAGLIIIFVGTITTSIFFTPYTIFSWFFFLIALGYTSYTFHGLIEGEIIGRTTYDKDLPEEIYDKHRNPIGFGLTLFAYWFVALGCSIIGILSLILIILYL